ncbi:MAG: heme-binding protein [Burkholderiales bacterium]|nr:heme-binding protein [Burkholderiales bacterium]
MKKYILTLDQAKKIAAAARLEAESNGWPVVIAIVDDGGHLLYLERADGTQFGSVEIAIAKARSAIAMKRPTKEWESRIAAGRLGILALPEMIPVEGGVPIAIEGDMVGAIGVSGVTSIQDGQIAAAGVAA